MRELILIRHGQSEYNVELTKGLDSNLTEEGIRQVRETGRFLSTHLGHIRTSFVGVVSPYLRCLQTARILGEETGIDVWAVDPRAREIMVHYDECHVPCRRDDFPDYKWNYPYTGINFKMETTENFDARMREYFNELYREHPDGAVLIVSHGTPTTALAHLSVGTYTGPGVSEGTYVANSSISYLRNNQTMWFNKVVY